MHMDLRDLGDRYHIETEIGRGSIGIIYRSRDRLLGRPVAVKMLRPELQDRARQRTRFMREAHLTGRLGHPNIVPMYDVGALDGAPCLVMGLLSGLSLRTYIRTQRAATAKMLSWFTQICNGVAFAHRAGIIHRDIKPAHVILGEYGQVVLTDWGLAKQIRSTDAGREAEDGVGRGSHRELTRHGDVIGTPAYMAPEQAAGRLNDVDHRVDIYALGAILYEILTGTRPYEASRSIEVLRAIRKGPPEPPCSRAPDRGIPQALESACMQAMAREPADRFATALELAAQIEAFVETHGAGHSGAYPAVSGHTLVDLVPPPPEQATASVHSMGADEEAERHLSRGKAEALAFNEQLSQARRYDEEAARQLATLPRQPELTQLQAVWGLESQARGTLDRAAHHLVQAAEALEQAAEAPEVMPRARQAQAQLHRDAWRAARASGDPINADYHRSRAEAFDEGPLRMELANRATLSVTVVGAERDGLRGKMAVELATVDDRPPAWTPGAGLRLGETPLSERIITATRCHLKLIPAMGPVVEMPLNIEPGSAVSLQISAPPRKVPPGFIFIPGGRFTLGADSAAPGACRPRQVTVEPFMMGRTVVTWESYFRFLTHLSEDGQDPTMHLPRHHDRLLVEMVRGRPRWKKGTEPPAGSPVRFISHADAEAFAHWMGRRLNSKVRLPTEAEWEYAAGGIDGRAFPWGGGYVPGFADNRRRRATSPSAIEAFPEDRSPFGIVGMGGGVREWTLTSADEPDRFLLRGGSWRARPDQVRICARATAGSALTHDAIGIRLVVEVPTAQHAHSTETR
ncbi:MAG: bifunctional serine/threonine-protein kinase/formylglycine-generating enzyme family protein [Bradymonadia bacterium]